MIGPICLVPFPEDSSAPEALILVPHGSEMGPSNFDSHQDALSETVLLLVYRHGQNNLANSVSSTAQSSVKR